MRNYENASFLMAGGACLVMLVNHIFNAASTFGGPLVPGFGHMAGLCIPVLCLWFGMTVRTWLKNPGCWVQALLLCLAVFCLYKFRHHLYAQWRTIAYLYAALICLGYLVPQEMLRVARRNKGWLYLALMLPAAFCYTAASVVESRLGWLAGSYLPEHQDMLRLMLTLMRDIGPLLIVIVLYFTVMFSFSKAGRWLGEKSWFRGIVIVPAVYLFFASMSNLVVRASWADFISFLVQPVTVCLVVMIVRLLGRYRERNNVGLDK